MTITIILGCFILMAGTTVLTQNISDHYEYIARFKKSPTAAGALAEDRRIKYPQYMPNRDTFIPPYDLPYWKQYTKSSWFQILFKFHY